MNFFSSLAIFLILMGAPQSINIRNVVWHGFPQPSEIPSCFTSTLFIMCASLGSILDEKSIALKYRSQGHDFRRFTFKMTGAPVDFTLLENNDEMIKIIHTSRWTRYTAYNPFWYEILNHFRNATFWRCVILLLPQIELLLRRIYGELNNFDITAKIDEYYIILNTIFDSNAIHSLNTAVGRGSSHFLYDIFISPYGLRIRDKVSHGEVDLNCLDKDVCSILLYAAFNLLAPNGIYSLDSYESRFHLNSLCHESIASARQHILQLINLQTPSEVLHEFHWKTECVTYLKHWRLRKPIEIFDRPNKEPEIMNLLIKIAQHIVLICENYNDSFNEKFQMLIDRQLRSRARKTLERLVEAMSVIATTLVDILKYIGQIYTSTQEKGPSWLIDNFTEVQRFCKETQTIVENLERCSDKTNNDWMNALDFCKKFDTSCAKFSHSLEIGPSQNL